MINPTFGVLLFALGLMMALVGMCRDSNHK